MSVRRIARLTGISASAVSLALHDSPKVSAATRRRVQKTAERLGYRPSAKVAELMAQVRARRESQVDSCLGVISLYDHPRPWELSRHLAGIHASMSQRARDLGYRLETLWLRAPGMTFQRFRAVLDARGIQGLLCFGSPILDDHFPEELDHYAVVSVGLSIQTPLHRVTSDFFNDAMQALNHVHALGYRRPGLVIGSYEEVRSAHAHSSAYLGWCERMLPGGKPLPVLRLDWMEELPFVQWFQLHRPDVIIVVHVADAVPELSRLLKRNHISVPGQVGVAVLTHYLEGTGFSGLQQNQELMGAWAVELLVARMMHRDLGIPSNPRIEMVESRWVDGNSLRRAPKSVPAS